LDIHDAGEEEDKTLLSSIPYVNIKREGEELLHFASRYFSVPCSIYRIPAVSVSTKGGFQGDLVSSS